MEPLSNVCSPRKPQNKGKLVGQKFPLKPKEIWAIRVRLQLANRRRELALFNLAIDSKLRGCDLVKLRVRDVCHGQAMESRTIVLQQKTQRPVQLEITEPTREAVGAWIGHGRLRSEDSLLSKPGSRLTAFIDATLRPDRGFTAGQVYCARRIPQLRLAGCCDCRCRRCGLGAPGP
jgi:site-specific recombinase XerC